MGIELNKIKKQGANANVAKSKENSIVQLLNRDLSFSKGLNDKKKYRFFTDLSLLISAGIDIRTAIELSIKGEKSKKTVQILEKVHNNVIRGSTFSESLRSTNSFSEYDFFSVKIGEESGNIKEVLKDLAFFYEGKIEFKRKLISTFSYPIIVLFTAFTAVFFMLNFIVPIFEDAFNRFGGELPLITQYVLGLSEWMQEYGLIGVLVLILFCLLLFSQRNKEWFRKRASLLLLKIPVIGEIAQKTYLARFCHSMSLLTGVNNPLVNSISLVRKMVRFYPLERALSEIENDIINGALFHTSLAKHSFFPERMVALIKVAEEVNKLTTVFEQIHKQYSDETENSSKVISSLLEPVLIIFIGLFVGIILVAMYLPLFEIGSGIQ